MLRVGRTLKTLIISKNLTMKLLLHGSSRVAINPKTLCVTWYESDIYNHFRCMMLIREVKSQYDYLDQYTSPTRLVHLKLQQRIKELLSWVPSYPGTRYPFSFEQSDL